MQNFTPRESEKGAIGGLEVWEEICGRTKREGRGNGLPPARTGPLCFLYTYVLLRGHPTSLSFVTPRAIASAKSGMRERFEEVDVDSKGSG